MKSLVYKIFLFVIVCMSSCVLGFSSNFNSNTLTENNQYLSKKNTKDYSSYYENLPIKMNQVSAPIIPDYTVSILDFGAIGDAIFLNTDAFSKAISTLSKQGGGHLVVPRGVWLTGPIRLKSNIDLHLEKGAILTFSPDKSLYLDDGDVTKRVYSCIRADKATNISITGEGIIDGGGKYWRYVKRSKVSNTEWNDFKELGGKIVKSGSDELWFPYDLKNFPNLTQSPQDEEALRAHMISIKRCSNVLISGVTVQNSPRFHINPFLCTNVILDGVTVKCPWNAQNGDGIDIGNCKRVLVTDCMVDVGDDGICMKGGSGETGLKNGACEDILIQNSVVFRGHGGFVVGSDFSGGLDRLVVRNCSFSGTDIGLRFKSAVGRGGFCKDVYIENITMNDILDAAISFDCSYSDVTYKTVFAAGEKLEYQPQFTNIKIENVVCRECKTGIFAKGIKGLDCIYGIEILNSTFFYTGKDQEIDKDSTEIKLKDIKFVTY